MQLHLSTELHIPTAVSQLSGTPLDLFSTLWARFSTHSEFSLLYYTIDPNWCILFNRRWGIAYCSLDKHQTGWRALQLLSKYIWNPENYCHIFDINITSQFLVAEKEQWITSTPLTSNPNSASWKSLILHHSWICSVIIWDGREAGEVQQVSLLKTIHICPPFLVNYYFMRY